MTAFNFDPAQGQIRTAWEDDAFDAVPAEANWHGHTFVKESLSSNAERIDDPSISGIGQRPRQLPSKVPTAGQINVALNAEGHLSYFAQVQKHASVANPTAGVYVQKMAPSETSVTVPKKRTVEVWRDDGMPQVFKGGSVSQIALSVAERQLASAAIDLQFQRADYWDKGSISGGGTAAGRMRGTPSYTTWTDPLSDIIYISITSITDIADVTDPRVVGKVKRGTAASYGSDATVTLRPNQWTELFDSNGGERLGTRAEPVQFMPKGVLTSITTSTVFVINRERTVWVQSLPDVLPFNEIFAVLSIDGGDYVIDTFNLTIGRPLLTKFGIGGRRAKRVLERGRRQVGGSFKRDYIDTYLRKKLEAEEPFQLVTAMYTGFPIGSTNYEHTYVLTSKNCVFSGTTAVIDSEGQMSENLNFTCHPSTDGTYPDDITIEATTSIADLTA